jgi:hypothetical protein
MKLVPQLTTYVRAIANDRSLTVRATAGETRTDGQVVYIRPPLKLGDEIPHEKAHCTKRDKVTRRQTCPACDQHEMIMACIYHEVAHIIFGSMVKPTPEGLKPIHDAIREWHPADACSHAEEIFGLIREWAATGNDTYLANAAGLDMGLKLLVNGLEDARVNNAMFTARPGTRAMMDANVAEVFEVGIDGSNEEMDRWQNRPVDEQIFIGTFLLASEYHNHIDELSDRAREIIYNEDVENLIAAVGRTQEVHEVVQVAVALWRKLQELGHFLTPKCVKPEIQPELPSGMPGEPDPNGAPGQGGDDEGDAGAADATGTGTESGQGGSDSSSGDDSGERQSDGTSGSSEELTGDSAAAPEQGASNSQDQCNADASEAEGGSGDPGDAGDQQSDGAGGGQDNDAGVSGGTSAQPAGTGGSSPQEHADDQGAGGGADPDESDGDAGSPMDDTDPNADTETGADTATDSTDSGGRMEDGSAADRTAEDGEEPGGDGDSVAEESAGEPEHDDEDAADSAGTPGGLGAPTEAGNQDNDSGGDGSDSEELYEDEGEEGSDPAAGLAEAARRLSLHDLIDQVNSDSNTKHFACGDSELHTRPVQPGSEEDSEDEVWMPGAGDAGEPGEIEELAIAILQALIWDQPSVSLRGMSILDFPHQRTGWVERNWGSDPKDYMPSEGIIGRLAMAAKLAFEENQRSKYQVNRKSGRVNPRALAKRVPAEDPRMFRKKLVPGKFSHHVVIGMDCSGSTSGSTADGKDMVIARSKRAVFAQAEYLSRLGISFEIWAHSAGYGLETADYNDAQGWLLAVKRAGQPWDAAAKRRLACVQPVSGNVDGHTLEFYRKQAEQSNALQKHVCYYTDGAMPMMNYDDELEVLVYNIDYCRKHNINLLAVAIETDSPADHGFNTVRVDSDDDLIKVVEQLQSAVA